MTFAGTGWPLERRRLGTARCCSWPSSGYRVIAHDRRSLRRGVQEHTEAAETGLSGQELPDEDPGADPGQAWH